MRLNLTEVTAENTFTEAFYAEYPLSRTFYQPGGVKFARGFAREFVIERQIGASLVERSLACYGQTITFTISGALDKNTAAILMDTEIEQDGAVYRFSSIEGSSYRIPYDENPCFGMMVYFDRVTN